MPERVFVLLQQEMAVHRFHQKQHGGHPGDRQADQCTERHRRIYDQSGTLNFFDNTVAGNTDTITLRGDVRNPLADARMDGTTRELVDGEFVTAILEDAEPIEAVTVPRAAVLTDQQGDYIYVVDSENKVQQRRVQLGPSTPGIVAVKSGLNDGEHVVVEGIQRIRPGQLVSPGTAGSADGTLGASIPG